MITIDTIEQFTAHKTYALIGASKSKNKFGNEIFKELVKKGLTVYQIHKSEPELNNAATFSNLAKLPQKTDALIVVAKPENGVEIVNDAINNGIKYIWFQQGSTNSEAIKLANEHNITTIYGKCILMFMPPVTSIHKFHGTIVKLFNKYPKKEQLKVVK